MTKSKERATSAIPGTRPYKAANWLGLSPSGLQIVKNCNNAELPASSLLPYLGLVAVARSNPMLHNETKRGVLMNMFTVIEDDHVIVTLPEVGFLL